MIMQTVLMYTVFCAAPFVYGIGLKKLLEPNPDPLYVCFSALKSVCTVAPAVCVSWFFAVYVLAPYSLSVLFPLFGLLITLPFSVACEKLIRLCFKLDSTEFDIAFLSVILALSESLSLVSALIAGVSCALSFYILFPIVAAIRKRLYITGIDSDFYDSVMIFVTFALLLCGLHGWNLSWLNAGFFK